MGAHLAQYKEMSSRRSCSPSVSGSACSSSTAGTGPESALSFGESSRRAMTPRSHPFPGCVDGFNLHAGQIDVEITSTLVQPRRGGPGHRPRLPHRTEAQRSGPQVRSCRARWREQIGQIEQKSPGRERCGFGARVGSLSSPTMIGARHAPRREASMMGCRLHPESRPIQTEWGSRPQQQASPGDPWVMRLNPNTPRAGLLAAGKHVAAGICPHGRNAAACRPRGRRLRRKSSWRDLEPRRAGDASSMSSLMAPSPPAPPRCQETRSVLRPLVPESLSNAGRAEPTALPDLAGSAVHRRRPRHPRRNASTKTLLLFRRPRVADEVRRPSANGAARPRPSPNHARLEEEIGLLREAGPSLTRSDPP